MVVLTAGAAGRLDVERGTIEIQVKRGSFKKPVLKEPIDSTFALLLCRNEPLRCVQPMEYSDPMTSTENTISRIVEKLVAVYDPREIYVFGSFARGNPGTDSDIDLCIIIKESHEKHADRIRKGLHALRGEKTAVDLLVFTEEEIADRKNHPSSLIHRVLSEGKILYAAA